MKTGGTRFVQLQDIKRQPASAMATREASNRRTLTKKAPKKSLKGIAKAIPGHFAPLIPGLESFQANETKYMNNDLTTGAAGLEPHYDIEHFVPEDEQGYRGVLMDPSRSHSTRKYTVRPKHIDRQRRTAKSQTAIASATVSPTHAYSHGQRASVLASYVNRLRHRESMPDHANHDRIIANSVAPLSHIELEAHTTKTPSVKRQIPKIIITPSSPTTIDFKFDVFDNTSLTLPPICYKKKERKRQAKADEGKMVELRRSRSLNSFDSVEAPNSFSKVEAPNRVQSDIEPTRSRGSFSNVDVNRRVRRNVEKAPSPFESYAYSLFG